MGLSYVNVVCVYGGRGEWVEVYGGRGGEWLEVLKCFVRGDKNYFYLV